MNIVFVLNVLLISLFSFVSSLVTEKFETTTSINLFSTLRQKVLSPVVISSQNNTDTPTTFQKKDLESKASYINSKIYAKPS